MKGKKWHSFLLMFFVTFFMFGAHSAYSAALAERQEIRLGLYASDITTLDPHFASTHADRPIIEVIYEGLVNLPLNSVNIMDIEPALAKSWSTSPDGKEWIFNLREGIQFHKGFGELTSEDIVFSLNRVRKDDSGSPFRRVLAAITDVEAVDKYTVRIKLSNPDPFFLLRLIGYQAGFIVSKKASEEMGKDLARNPIGTGPFQFDSYRERERVTLIRNDKYYKGVPILEKVEYFFMPDEASRELAIRTGEIHAAEGVADVVWIRRMQQSGLDLNPVGGQVAYFLHYNMTKPPFDDIRIRKALSHAIDREAIVEYRGEVISEIINSPVPLGYFGQSTEGVPVYEYSLEKARALLADAGYKDGFQFDISISESPIYLQHMEIIQDMWRKIGVRMNMKVVDHSSYHAVIRQNANAVVYYAAARLPIADIYLTQFYHSDSIIGKPTAITNFSHFGDIGDNIDDLLEKARFEMDADKQLEMYRLAQQKIMEVLAALPILHSWNIGIKQPYLDLGDKLKDNRIPNLTDTYRITEKTRLLKR